MATATKSFDKDHLDELEVFVDQLLAGPGYDRAKILSDASGLFEYWKEFRPPLANARHVELDATEEFGAGEALAEQAEESGEWERTRWVFVTVEYDYDHHVLVAVSADIRTPDGSSEQWQDLYRNLNDPAELAAHHQAHHPEQYADLAAPAEDDASWHDAAAGSAPGSDHDPLGPPPASMGAAPVLRMTDLDDGDYAYGASEGDLWIYPLADLDLLVRQHASDPSAFGRFCVARGGFDDFVSVEDAIDCPTEGAGRLTLAAGLVTGWEQVVPAGAEEYDRDDSYATSLAALELICAEGTPAAARTTKLLYGNGVALLGEQGFAAIRAVGGEQGTVTFKRNRTSANELLVGDVAVDDRLRTILKAMVKEIDYPYRDRDRVVVK